jgi:hypothetical protein
VGQQQYLRHITEHAAQTAHSFLRNSYSAANSKQHDARRIRRNLRKFFKTHLGGISMQHPVRHQFRICDIKQEADFLMGLAAQNTKRARGNGDILAGDTLGVFLAQDIARDYQQSGNSWGYQFYALVCLFCEYEELANVATYERFQKTLEFGNYVSLPDIFPFDNFRY